MRAAPRDSDWKLTIRAIEKRLGGGPLPSVSEVARKNPDPFRVLVATMISLRTKDAVTEVASDRLLAAAPDPASLASLGTARIARLIYPAGFYRTKAAHLREAARILVERHGSMVPSSMDELLALPGVGRKTANLVRNLGFGLPGICVDTHVHRVSNRLGWVSTRNPAETERALETVLPKRYWIPINELLVRFGQSVCAPTSPWCSQCPFGGAAAPARARSAPSRLPHCPRVGVGRSR